jgi:putative two-component system response regulator
MASHLEVEASSARVDQPHRTTLLVVEDDQSMLVALRDILRGAGYEVRTAQHGEEALDAFKSQKPSLILSDISMPVMDGIELFEAVRKLPGGMETPFIFLTARRTREDIFVGKSLGADDYITKPITSKELLSAVEVRLRRADELKLVQLKSAYKASLLALAQAIEARDEYTHWHVIRLNEYAQAIAEELGWDDDRLEALEFGAILHDIGKLDVPLRILQKKDPLTPEEWEEMRKHPEYGVNMIRRIEYLAPALSTVLHHHERWDGTGYPDGLKGEQIPEGARLLAIVDAFDAMTTDRKYRAAILVEDAYQEIVSKAGIEYDPEFVKAFSRCWKRGEIQRIKDELRKENQLSNSS